MNYLGSCKEEIKRIALEVANLTERVTLEMGDDGSGVLRQFLCSRIASEARLILAERKATQDRSEAPAT